MSRAVDDLITRQKYDLFLISPMKQSFFRKTYIFQKYIPFLWVAFAVLGAYRKVRAIVISYRLLLFCAEVTAHAPMTNFIEDMQEGQRHGIAMQSPKTGG